MVCLGRQTGFARVPGRIGAAGIRSVPPGTPVVRTAAAESTGLHYYEGVSAEQERPADRDRELLIASIDELTPEDRRHVAALIESLRTGPHRNGGPLW